MGGLTALECSPQSPGNQRRAAIRGASEDHECAAIASYGWSSRARRRSSPEAGRSRTWRRLRLRWSPSQPTVADVSAPTPAIAVLNAIGTHLTFHNPSLPTDLPTLRELAESLRLDEASAEGLLQQAINDGEVEEPRRERGHSKLTAAGKAKWDEHLTASE